MRVFVASWFFPPATSSEGIVTYKLLRNSKNIYDVCSSTSKMWGYNAKMDSKDDGNIRVFPIDTNDINEWVDWCIEKFKDLNDAYPYDAIMTRSTPPESILVGKKIKELYPDIKWIASLADPVSNNPYELKAYIDDCSTLSRSQKQELKMNLLDSDISVLKKWETRPEFGIKYLCKLKKWEKIVLDSADLIISPTSIQLRYILGGKGWNNKFFALPHSFDETFYHSYNVSKVNKNKIVLSFLGYSDKLRSLKPILQAFKLAKEEGNSNINKLELRIIGNNPRELEDYVLNNYLYDQIKFYKNVDYYKSLELMQESDWLIHVDAYFQSLPTGGSIFFAGKLADYMGARKPILGITGVGSPSYNIIKKYGGKCFLFNDIEGISSCLCDIAENFTIPINEKYREEFSAKVVAERFDNKLDEIKGNNNSYINRSWPKPVNTQDTKVLSICVPAYNVEKYLDRCLFTLVNHDMAGYLDIIVVDDGSKDRTAEIGRQYENKYPGIVRLISKENGGHGSTINVAIEQAKGYYFRTVDGDDWVDSNQLSDLIKNVLKKNCEVDIISSNYHEVNMDTSQLVPVVQLDDLEYWKTYSFDDLDVSNIYLTLASLMIKTDILKKMQVKLLEHAFYVDVEFITFPVPYIHNIVFTDHFIYKYMRGNAEQSVAIPNMVKRYDNHNRVMHRIISYKQKVDMDRGQRKYYDAILMRLLRTHYGLGLIYDKDISRGCARARRFDQYLKNKDNILYKQIGKEMAIVDLARKCKFDPKVYGKLSAALNSGMKDKFMVTIKSNGKTFAKKIIYNPLSITIAQSKLINEGKLKKLKDKTNIFFDA